MSTRSSLPSGLLLAPLFIAAAYFWPRHYQLSTDAEDAPLRVFANGKLRGELSAPAPSLDFWKLGLAELTAQAPTPCGWKAIGLSSAGEETDLKVEPITYPDTVDGRESWTGAHVWYDNRGGAAAEISVDEFHMPISADGRGAFRIWLSTCPGPFVLRIDGTEGGHVVADSSYFIDLSGRRCYAWETVVYGYPSLSHQPGGSTLGGARVYTVPWLSYVFEEPPDSIQSFGAFREVVALREADCG